MSNIEAGGSAFPTGTYEYDGAGNVLPYQDDGMTLRDYFATKALQGISCNLQRVNGSDGKNILAIVELNAALAYLQANAMLKARGV